MKDGSDAVADWPILNALLKASSGADLVAIHGLGGHGVCAGVTIVAGGNAATADRLKRVFDGDSGLGVLRHADAGYDAAIEQADRFGLSSTVASGVNGYSEPALASDPEVYFLEEVIVVQFGNRCTGKHDLPMRDHVTTIGNTHRLVEVLFRHHA